MRRHKKDVERVVGLLAYMLKSSDPNGLDLYFTLSNATINSRKSHKLVNAVCKAQFGGISDMRGRLTTIIQEHRSNFGKMVVPKVPFYKKTPPPQPQRPLSFYVLTDAKWQPNSVDPLIESLVQEMLEHKLPKEHVGIQFIRFGNDEECEHRLDHLDHGLGLSDIDM